MTIATVSDITSQLIRDEGEILYAYPDSRSYWTIGVGRCIDRRVNGGITEAESRYLLANNIAAITTELHAGFPWTTNLDSVRFGVLQNMCLNMGLEGLEEFKLFLAAVERSDWQEASVQMLQSTWAAEVGDRAIRLSQQIVTGQWV